MTKKSCIYVVATPIGNVSDISQRAIQTLSDADLIAAEDTRQTRKLLSILEIEAPKIISYFDHNETFKSEKLVEQLLATPTVVALVSDAGTPCISDPGYRLISLAKEKGIDVCPIPGPSSLIALVSASGLPSDRFLFVGFPSAKEKALESEIGTWKDAGGSVVFFESPHRIKNTLKILQKMVPEIKMSLGRELTKVYEEIVTLPVSEMVDFVENHKTLKGEMVCMLSFPQRVKKSETSETDIMVELKSEVIAAFGEGYSHKDLCKEYSDCGLTRKVLFKFLLDVKSEI